MTVDRHFEGWWSSEGPLYLLVLGGGCRQCRQDGQVRCPQANLSTEQLASPTGEVPPLDAQLAPLDRLGRLL